MVSLAELNHESVDLSSKLSGLIKILDKLSGAFMLVSMYTHASSSILLEPFEYYIRFDKQAQISQVIPVVTTCC